MLNRPAKVVSDIFNPVLLSSGAFAWLILSDRTLGMDRKVIQLGACLLFSSVFVIGYVFYLLRKGHVTNADIDVREQRLKPFAVGIAIYLAGFAVLEWLDAPRLVRGLMLCYATNTLVVLVITKWWKVSVHAMGVCGPLVALTFQFGAVIWPFYSLIPLVGISRVILKKHTTGQVIVGSILGLSLTAIQLFFFLQR